MLIAGAIDPKRNFRMKRGKLPHLQPRVRTIGNTSAPAPGRERGPHSEPGDFRRSGGAAVVVGVAVRAHGSFSAWAAHPPRRKSRMAPCLVSFDSRPLEEVLHLVLVLVGL